MDLPGSTKERFIETKKEVFSQTLTLVNSAFGFVAALAWNEAIKALIEEYFKAGSGLYSKFIYAIIVTVILVIVATRLNKIAQRFHIEIQQKK